MSATKREMVGQHNWNALGFTSAIVDHSRGVFDHSLSIDESATRFFTDSISYIVRSDFVRAGRFEDTFVARLGGRNERFRGAPNRSGSHHLFSVVAIRALTRPHRLISGRKDQVID